MPRLTQATDREPRLDGMPEFVYPSTATSHNADENAPHLVALARAGATFVNGVLVERAEPGKETA
jgi:hypothetical protein